jgi:hypothetical protein
MQAFKAGVTEAALQDFIGKNANKIIRRGSKDISWCWPALFVPSLWLAYRKAYFAAFLVFVVDAFCSAWGLYIMIDSADLGFHHPWLVSTLVRIAIALFGLRYYFNLANNRVARIYNETADLETRKKLFKAKGGTSVSGMLLFLILSSALGTVVYGKGVQTIAANHSTTQITVMQTTKTVS